MVGQVMVDNQLVVLATRSMVAVEQKMHQLRMRG